MGVLLSFLYQARDFFFSCNAKWKWIYTLIAPKFLVISPWCYTFVESLGHCEFNWIKIFETFRNVWRHKTENPESLKIAKKDQFFFTFSSKIRSVLLHLWTCNCIFYYKVLVDNSDSRLKKIGKNRVRQLYQKRVKNMQKR